MEGPPRGKAVDAQACGGGSVVAPRWLLPPLDASRDDAVENTAAVGTFISTAVGVGMIALAIRDAFDALFHPEGRATFGRVIPRAVWRLLRPTGAGHPLFPLAGPFALIAVIATWAGLLIVGWALIFLPHMPEDFRLDPAITGG